MFDVNPDAAKFYLKDLERQATASRRLREVPPHKSTENPLRETRPGSLVGSCGRLGARVFATAVRGAVAAVFQGSVSGSDQQDLNVVLRRRRLAARMVR